MKLSEIPEAKLVYTTKNIVTKQVPVLYFTLDVGGDLQALCPAVQINSDPMIISYRQLVELDNTILNIVNIEQGEAYWRSRHDAEGVLFRK